MILKLPVFRVSLLDLYCPHPSINMVNNHTGPAHLLELGFNGPYSYSCLSDQTAFDNEKQVTDAVER